MPDNTQQQPVVFGEVLYDRFPDNSSVLGGAPFNVAWHLQAFGQTPLLVSAVGNDDLGHQIERAMDDWNLDQKGLQQDNDHPTGTVEVHIEDDEPSYDIVSDCAYDFIKSEQLPTAKPALLYHGTLALRNSVSNNALVKLKQAGSPIFLDVNLRPPWWDKQTIARTLTDATWAKLNEDELNILMPSSEKPEQKADKLLKQYRLELLILTRGSQGAIAFDTIGNTITVQPESDICMVDSVGAGDAFTSVIIAGLLQKWPLAETMERAQAFASAIVGVRGATTQDKDFYNHFTSQWELTD
jgi:fructokinase